MTLSQWKWSAQNLTIVFTASAGVFAVLSWRFMPYDWVYWPCIALSVILLFPGIYYLQRDMKETRAMTEAIEKERQSLINRDLVVQLTEALELVQGRDWRLLGGDEFDQEVKRRALLAIQAGKRALR